MKPDFVPRRSAQPSAIHDAIVLAQRWILREGFVVGHNRELDGGFWPFCSVAGRFRFGRPDSFQLLVRPIDALGVIHHLDKRHASRIGFAGAHHLGDFIQSST